MIISLQSVNNGLLEDFKDYLKWLNKIVGIIEKAGF